MIITPRIYKQYHHIFVICCYYDTHALHVIVYHQLMQGDQQEPLLMSRPRRPRNNKKILPVNRHY